jgi:outer membrane protein assembly factor BamD (BamD/ComL family)
MVLAYQKLGLEDLAADTQRVIDYNDFSDISTTVDPDKYGKAPPSTL